MTDRKAEMVEFNRCGEWVTHVALDGRGWRHTDDQECPVCRGEVQSAAMRAPTGEVTS